MTIHSTLYVQMKETYIFCGCTCAFVLCQNAALHC